MDAASDAAVHTVVVMSSAQVGKTETILNALGFYIHQDPAPILLLQPTLEMAAAFSKDRLAPMLRDTPALQGLVKDPRARDSGNTQLHKQFPGGHITMAGANSPASLASRPVRVVLADEVDRYPPSAGSEGDPVSLARKRSTTFWNRKLILTSTPTVKGESRIEAAYRESDRRRYLVPCPDCGEEQSLRWHNVRWPEGEPSAAEYACEACGSLWSDVMRWSAIRRGRWQAEGEFRGVAGFWLSELYSPWVRLGETAQAFVEAKGDPERLKTWVNTALGETWEERGDGLEPVGLDRLRENYWPDNLPAGVQVATAGIDVQGDRLEVEVVGWGAGEESAGIEYRIFEGDPAKPDVWAVLDEFLMGRYRTADGRDVHIAAACIDSGGHHTEAVYRFCRDRARRKVWAVKGRQNTPQNPLPVWPRQSSKGKGDGMVWIVGVDTAKDAIYARFQIDEPGPGYCHLPADPETGYDDRWAAQVTAEQRVTRFQRGRPYSVWELPKGRRNEALDCRVYAFAALKSLRRRLSAGRDDERPRRLSEVL